MSQKSQSDGSQKHFAVGRGLLAAAETLNFNMNEQRSSRQMGGMTSGVGMGGGGGGEGKDGTAQMSRHGSGSNLGSTMKLFASLGLSPSDLDALAEIPEEDISVETLPQILMQLKSRKGDKGERRAASSMSSDAVYRGGREGWEDGHVGRMGGPSLGQGSARAQPSADFGYNSLQDVSSSRGYNLNYSSSSGSGGGGSRERPYSELSHQDSYSGIGMGPSPSDSVFMQRRMGSPSNGKIQDFLGVMPPMFPHVCSLCDFDVHSTMEWNQHTNGLRHAENRRQLLDMYPTWDPGMASGRGGGLLETPNLSAGLLGPTPSSSGQAGGMSSSWGGSGGPGLLGKNQPGQNKLRSRVVVVKYDRRPLSNKTLFAFTEPFGCLREHLVLKNKAFMEMNSHEEALDMVNYYEQHPAALYGKPITFYLSQRLLVIEKEDRASDKLIDRPVRDIKGHGSKVVFFSNLPRQDEKKRELLTIAGRFGIVEKHLFLTDQAFVQLGTVEDAEMLVKYYSVNPLTIKGRPIRLNICAKYKTLNVNRRLGGDAQSRRRPSTSSSTSRTSSSKSSSRTRDEKKKKEEEDDGKVKPEEKPAAVKEAVEEDEEEEEEEEEVSGVLQGGEEGGEEEEVVTDGDADGEEPEGAESVKETVEESSDIKEDDKEVPDASDITADTPGDVCEAEAQQGAEPEIQTEQTETETSTDEHKDEAAVDAAESSEAVEGDLPEHMFEQDFLENMEDFVTLDELGDDEDEAGGSDAIDNTRRGGMRVVNIVGFRRGHNFLNELLGLAKPFGKVVKHLVLDLRPEAFLQFDTEEEARAMNRFYNSNVVASVCGRPVRVSHSMSYPTIQCGSSRVVYVGQLPSSKYADEDILKLAEPYGVVRKYFLNRIRRECFIEMERAEDAEKMAESYKVKPPRLEGKRLTVYVSRKYRQLKHGHRRPTTTKRIISLSPPPKSSQQAEEPPAKKPREEVEQEDEEKIEEEEKKKEKEEEEEEKKKKEEKKEEYEQSCEEKMEENSAEKIPDVCDEKQKSSEDLQEVKQEEQLEEAGVSTNQKEPNATDNKPKAASLPLPPYDPNSAVGVEHVKMGYYCRVCYLFYSNEDTAKKTHCSSQIHYDKLQKYLEREQTKSEKKKGKKTQDTKLEIK
ncbi:matrin 3-like 1.2 [Stegastes partitus]|uniref:Matrin-3 n=1 Tax=Stegastes partitus TaxID=144197 RepID=A0A3B4ZXX3_9TELE|nr:PREDICTED: matrin-3 [Stegastes partitus]